MAEKKQPMGFDLVDVEPDFGKETKADFWKRYSKRYFEVYGEYPETPPELAESQQ